MDAEHDAIPQRDARNRLVPGPMLSEVEDPARRRRRRWLVRISVALGVLLLLTAFHRPLLTGFAGLFRVDDPAPSDALVVLLGGPTNRPQRAAELYRRGIAPLILIGTSTDDPHARLNETQMAID